MKVINREIIKESLEELTNLQKTVKHPRLVNRLIMLSLLKKDPKLSLKDVSTILNFDYRTIKTWWIKYKKGGIDELLNWNVKGRKSWLSDEQLKLLKDKLKEKDFKTQKEIAEFIEKEFGVRYSQQGVSRLLKKLDTKNRNPS